MIDDRVIELIHSRLDGELSHAGRQELAACLERSEEARRYLAKMEELTKAIDGLPAQELPDRLHQRIVERAELPKARLASQPLIARIPVVARYGLAMTAGLLIAVVAYEYRPKPSEVQDYSSMTGTIMPDGKGSPAVVIDKYSFQLDQLSGSASLEDRDGTLVLDLLLDSTAMVTVRVEFASGGLLFDAISQQQGQLTSIEVIDQAVQVTASGLQHFAVLMQRGGALMGGAAIIRVDYLMDDNVLNSREIVVKEHY